ncbi:BspA family leucine-rich repeat surface protein [Lactiplantibacillus paraxiangfangensis]|uniref:BspA family leucine-rich repeat surface protein n=1 Tax=Lactiplantibacillus paraxiangfangensis TaxID=3076224 RepID=UPI0030C672EE
MVKNGQLTEVRAGKVTGRFWLMAGAALLTWQINNQIVQADTVSPTDHVTASVNTKVTTGPTSGGSSAAQSVVSATGSSAAPTHESQASAVKAVSQPASETGTSASSVVNASQAGSEAKSEQSQTGALSQVGSSQAVSEASSAVKGAAQPVVVKSMARIKAASQAQPATYRLRMAAPAVPVAAVNDHTSGTLGTSKWSIDTTTDTLTIGPGTLADTGVTADAKGKITDWKGLDWNNYQLSDPNSRLKLQLNGPVVVGKDASYLFSGLDLDDMDATKPNTQKTTNMTGMFYNAHSSGIDTQSIFNFDTSNVETMAYMFNKYVQPYSTLDISNLNTSHVADMTAMFAEMKGIQSINLSNFDTSSVTSMAQMFQQSSDLQSLDLSKFKTSEVKDMDVS